MPATLLVARVALESTRRPLWGMLIVIIGLLAALAGVVLGRKLLHGTATHW